MMACNRLARDRDLYSGVREAMGDRRRFEGEGIKDTTVAAGRALKSGLSCVRDNSEA
jgi:hypothetical protein